MVEKSPKQREVTCPPEYRPGSVVHSCGSGRPVHHPAGLFCWGSGPTFALLRWWEHLDDLYALDRVDRVPVGNLLCCPLKAFGVRHCRDLTLIDIPRANPAEQGKGMSGGVFQ